MSDNKQRKGQWLYNKIRQEIDGESRQTDDEYVGRRIWNMSNKEYDEFMKDYDQS